MGPQKNVALEPDIFAQVSEEARRAGRTADELTNEAAKRFLALRQLKDLGAYGQERAAASGSTADDVPRLIAESRRERRR